MDENYWENVLEPLKKDSEEFSDPPSDPIGTEREVFKRKAHQYYLDEWEIKNQDFKQKVFQRWFYALFLFTVLIFWMINVLAIIMYQGFHIDGFDLDPTVLCVFLGTTTVSAFSLVGVVVKSIFSQPS